MNPRAKFLLQLQYMTGRLLVFITVPLIVLAVRVAGYRIRDLGAVRQKVGALFAAHPGPWLICPNHLTMIDSVILAYAMVPPGCYLVRYRLLPWNMPELKNYADNIFLVVICYLMKCVPVVRGGDRAAVKTVMDKCNWIMGQQENLMIFPEGMRSRTGRVRTRDFPYSSGRLFLTVPGTRVMCIYLRGQGQDRHSAMPRYRERFSMAVEEIRPRTEFKGLRAQRDISCQIIAKLSGMEEAYFAPCGK